VLTDYEPPGKTVPWKGLRRRKDPAKGPDPAIPATPAPAPGLGPSVSDFIPIGAGAGTPGEGVRFGPDTTTTGASPGGAVNTNIPSPEALAVPLQAVEAAEEDVPITRLSEGRALLSRPMLDFQVITRCPPSYLSPI